MNAMTKIVAAVVMIGATSFVSTSVNATWWDNDRRYDRWYGGPWYGHYPGWWGYRGWGGYPGWGWGNYPGYNRGSTIIVNPRASDSLGESVSLPRYSVPE
jgi:hypothetical protein